MSSTVFFGSPRQARLDAKETLPAKLDLILEQLKLRERVKDETVVIKMHTGTKIGYSTVHPVFVRKVVQAIKEGGGRPYIADVTWDAKGAEERGYSSETLGCPVYAAAGPGDKYFYEHERPFKNIKKWQVAGMIRRLTRELIQRGLPPGCLHHLNSVQGKSQNEASGEPFTAEHIRQMLARLPQEPEFIKGMVYLGLSGGPQMIDVATLEHDEVNRETGMVRRKRIKVDDAKVVKTDVPATNGIIHVIDSVLLPPDVKLGAANGDVGRTITRAIEHGVPLFNSGNVEACAAVYEVTAATVLDLAGEQLEAASRARLERGLREARHAHGASDRAWALRHAFDDLLAAERGMMRLTASQ